MTPTAPHTGDHEMTTELHVTARETAKPTEASTGEPSVTPERRTRRAVKPRAPRDIYQRRRETAAAALLVAGGTLIWSQIGESVTALLGR